jgi:hypothetical protein
MPATKNKWISSWRFVWFCISFNSTNYTGKVPVGLLVKKFRHFVELEISFPYSQEPAVGFYPEPWIQCTHSDPLLRYILILSSHLLMSPKWSFSSGDQTFPLYLLSCVSVIWLTNFILLCLIPLTTFVEEYKLWNFFLFSFLQFSVTFSILFQTFSSAFGSQITSVCVSHLVLILTCKSAVVLLITYFLLVYVKNIVNICVYLQ